jgi:hypothetical protein
MSAGYDLYHARAKMERTYQEFTHRHPGVRNILVHAERDIFRAIVLSLEHMQNLTERSSLAPDVPVVPNFCYKNAHVFQLERDGFALKFMGAVEETYR